MIDPTEQGYIDGQVGSNKRSPIEEAFDGIHAEMASLEKLTEYIENRLEPVLNKVLTGRIDVDSEAKKSPDTDPSSDLVIKLRTLKRRIYDTTSKLHRVMDRVEI